MNNRYSIYPSLLDAYTYMQGIEDATEREFKRLELIAKLNRVKQPPTEAASRGTALNEIVDSLIMNRSVREDMTATKGEANGNYPVWNATLDGFSFCFDAILVDTLYEELHDCLCQVFTKAEIEVPQGIVTLYGFPDYVRDNSVIDLKSTSNYNGSKESGVWLPKYRDHWQHYVYPYCLVKQGYIDSFDTFSYLVAEVSKGRDNIIHANLYHEDYNPSMSEIENTLKEFLTYNFIPFLEDNRHLITDPKVFS